MTTEMVRMPMACYLKNSASKCRIIVVRGASQHLAQIHPRLDEFDGDMALDRLRLQGHLDAAHTAFADACQHLYLPAMTVPATSSATKQDL